MKDCDPREDRTGVNRAPSDSLGLKAGWHKPGFDRSDWHKVRVPTSVQSALLKLGQIPDPLFGSNTVAEMDQFGKPKEELWQSRHTRIEQKDWFFARQFTVPKEWEGKPVRLHFDGIDYGGSVYLNGASLGYPRRKSARADC